jgi:hypothetical protein
MGPDAGGHPPNAELGSCRDVQNDGGQSIVTEETFIPGSAPAAADNCRGLLAGIVLRTLALARLDDPDNRQVWRP